MGGGRGDDSSFEQEEGEQTGLLSSLNKAHKPSLSGLGGKRTATAVMSFCSKALVNSEISNVPRYNPGDSEIQSGWSKLPLHGIKRISRRRPRTHTCTVLSCLPLRDAVLYLHNFPEQTFPLPFVQLSKSASSAAGRRGPLGGERPLIARLLQGLNLIIHRIVELMGFV